MSHPKLREVPGWWPRGSARAARLATVVAVMAIAPLLAASDCGGGYDDIPEPRRNEWKGHPGPVWGRAGDDTVIVFGWHEGGRDGSLYMIREDGTGLTLLSESVGDDELWGRGVAYDSSPAISPDGTRLAYQTRRDSGWLGFNIATTTLEEKRVLFFFFGGGREHQSLGTGKGFEQAQAVPTWSPDGTRIAFLRGGVLHTMAADGSDMRLIAPGFYAASWESPAWSPDGTRLAFHVWEDEVKEVALYVVDADGSNLRRVAPSRGGVPKWSPDGRRLAFTGEGARAHVVGIDDDEPEVFLRNYRGPMLWSPDGSELLVTHIPIGLDGRDDRIPRGGLFAITVEGPDGELRGIPEPYVSTADGRSRVRLVTSEFPIDGITGLAGSPDGTRIAVLRTPSDPLLRHPSDVLLSTVGWDGSDAQVLLRHGPDGELVVEGEAAR